MTDKTKKIIAREGLIALTAIILASTFYFTVIQSRSPTGAEGVFCFFAFYVVIKFVIWAVKTLKKK